MMRRLIIAAALLSAAPVSAQVAPAAAVAAPDAARLAIGRDIAGRLLPDGTFEKIMSAMMGNMMKRVTDSMMDLPMRSLAGVGGVDPAKLKELGPGTMRQMMSILDPAFDQRLEIMTGVMGPEMGRLMTTMEPDFREGLAEAYASRFSEAELTDVAAFFKTPAGNKFAQQIMTMQTDPAFLNRMQAMIPKLMQAMPAIMQKVEAATSKLPKARKYADLTPAEKAELNKLMGIDPAKVK